MNISQLRTFVSVIEGGSFSEAARRMGISQPAVTLQIQALEADLGATLLDRRYRSIDLTDAGRVLLPYARQVLAEVEDAREGIAALSGTLTGRLVIAASTTPGVYVIPRLLGRFLAENPEVGVTITVHDTTGVVEEVASGRASFGVSGAVVKGARATFAPLGTDELVLICPNGSPLAARKDVPVAALADMDWVMRESGSGTRQVAEAFLTAHELDTSELRVIVELGTGEAMVSAVEGGLGIAMLSLRVAEKALALGTVARVDLLAPAVTRTFFSVLPKATPTRAAEAFSTFLQAELARS